MIELEFPAPTLAASASPVGASITFGQHDVILFLVAFGEQRSHFAQLFPRLLAHPDLFAKVRTFLLLLPQDLVTVLHTSHFGNLRRARAMGQR